MVGSVNSIGPVFRSVNLSGFAATGAQAVSALSGFSVGDTKPGAIVANQTRAVAPLWRAKQEPVSAVKRVFAPRTGNRLVFLPRTGVRSVRATGGVPNIVGSELVQLRAKAKPVPEDKPAYAAVKSTIFRLDPQSDLYVQVYNQPDNQEFVVVTVGLDLAKAVELGLFQKTTNEEGKTELVASGEGRKKVYVELGNDDVSYTKANSQGNLFFLTIQVPFAALKKNDQNRFGFEVVVDGKAYPFEVAQRSHDALGFV